MNDVLNFSIEKPSPCGNLKICFITMIFPASSETFACNDARMLRTLGADLTVHTMRCAQHDKSRLLAERELTDLSITHATFTTGLQGLWVALTRPSLFGMLLSFILCHCRTRLVHLFKSILLIPRTLQIFSLIEKECPDIIHLYWGHYPSLVAYLVQQKLPSVVTSISLSAYDLLAEYGGSGAVARRADVVTTWARTNLGTIERLDVPKDRILLAYQGLDLDRFREHVTQKIRHRIITVGRLVPEKGMADVLKVFQQVRAQWPDAILVVVGDGTDRARLEAMVEAMGLQQAVHFKGSLPQAQVFEEMAAAEVFLFMSTASYERLPNVVKEAIASRCFCVVTETPGIEELLQDGKHGYVVPPGAFATAAERINDIFASPASFTKMLDEAYAHVFTHFDLRSLIEGLLHRWQAAVAAKKDVQKHRR